MEFSDSSAIRIITPIKNRIDYLKQIIRQKETDLENWPEGRLRLSYNGNYMRYYHVTKENRKRGVYIPKNNTPLISSLAQKDYDLKVLKKAQEEYKLLEKLLLCYDNGVIEQIILNIHPERKSLIKPIILPDDEYVKQWLNVPYNKMGFKETAPEYFTINNERVRSKTELLIANALHAKSVPYRYEYPIVLNGAFTVHPDFMVLNVRLRKEYLWEHFGMMDNPDYAKKALKKISEYQINGYYPGRHLLITHETSTDSISTLLINRIIDEFLL